MDVPDIKEMGPLAGSIVAGLFVLGAVLSKFRTVWTHDSANVAANAATTTVIEMLRNENERLHSQVLALQGEVAKLQTLVAELTARLGKFEINQDQQEKLNQMAREGKLERRKGRE